MQTLGEDLVLLAINLRSGRLASADRLRFGLMGAELVRLAADRRVDIAGDRIVLLDAAPTGDPELDAALASLAQAKRPPRPRSWVGSPRRGIRDAYLARLASAGTIRADQGGLLPGTRWRIADEARAADVRARLDAIAVSRGPVDSEQAALAGLASASGLSAHLYPGWGNRERRKRLDQLAQGQPVEPAAGVASQAAADAATRAATDAAVQAATDAAVAAAVHAAHHAAVAHSAAVHGGGHG